MGRGSDRLDTLDALRGVAALSVVFWHYRHFYFDPVTLSMPVGANPDMLPGYAALWPLYRFGLLGVDLFFSISGFIFFHLYLQAVAGGQIGARRFFVLRFSRLYPLHFVTLLFVAMVQPLHELKTGAAFVYQANDAATFMRHLALASDWLPQLPYGFNAPIWSVSVEIVLYALFFLLARSSMTHPLLVAACAIAGLSLAPYIGTQMSRGIFSFFIGGLCCQIVASRRLLPVAVFALVVIASFICARQIGYFEVVRWSSTTLVFPLLIIAAVMAEQRLRKFTASLRWLGQISYSSYLLHFPLQLIFVTVAAWLAFKPDYRSFAMLIVFMAALIGVSLLSYHFLEAPAQQLIRGLRRRPLDLKKT
jgi:peptidoglycan/LPS O-acetylase OafA/YrhL